MRKNIILLCCVLIFIAFVAFVKFQISKDAQWIEDNTSQLLSSLDNNEQSERVFNQLNDYWQRRSLWLGMVVSHDNIEEVSKEINKLEAALKSQNNEDAAIAVYSINFQMQQMVKRNSLRWDHIF